VEVSVADTGPGIAPELADRLFQPFVTSKKTGMGLGLSICREIVEAHHGRLLVAARPTGGTVFRLLLPKAEPSEDADAG
jgi:two-component system sensor kinase FixL